MDRREINEALETDNEEMEIDLWALVLTFFGFLRKYWWLALTLFFLGAGGFCAYRYIGYEPDYRCKATFTVATDNENAGLYNFYYAKDTAAQLSKTFPYILDSTYFQSLLTEELGVRELNGKISMSVLEESNVVTMTVESSGAEESYRILEAALTVYPKAAKFVLGTIQFHMLDVPQIPSEPYNAPVFFNVMAKGMLIGLFFCLLVFGFLSMMSRTVRTPEEMNEITSLKCLAAIPQLKMKARKNSVHSRVISVLDKRTDYGYVESIRALQMRLERIMRREKGKVLLVTSTASGEGKSLLAVNLAEMFASRGKKVALIDADLRKQDDAALLGCADGVGLNELLDGRGMGETVIRKMKEKGFWFIGGSRPVQNPARILSHPDFPRFLEIMKQKMDYVILDAAPCGEFQDAAILEEYADGILYAVKYDFMPRRKIKEGLSFLRNGKAKILGYVFTQYPQGGGGSYGYGRYGYGRYGYGRYGYGNYGYGRSKEDEME